jgi:hypothetical protein
MTGAAAPFLRFNRDKRGYEHFYLVQPTTNRRGKTRARILYWFRTPPGVKVGRLPFDPDVQRTIEAQNPGITFDWKRLLATPIPPPSQDVERWRERRRLERAEKAARRALRAADGEVAPEPEPEDGADDDSVGAGLRARPEDADNDVEASLPARPEDDDLDRDELTAVAFDSPLDNDRDPAALQESSISATADPQQPSNPPSAHKRRRRRRRGRRNKGPASGGSPPSNEVA